MSLPPSLLAESPVGMVVTTAEGRVRWANPSALSFFGLSREEVLRRPIDELLRAGFRNEEARGPSRSAGEGPPAEPVPPAELASAEPPAEGSDSSYVDRLPQKRTVSCKRTGRWFELRVLPASGDARTQDECERLFYMIDVSDRIERLRSRELYFRSIIESSVDLLLILDDQGRISFATQSMTRLLGASRDDAQGTDLADWCHPEDCSLLERLADPEFLAGQENVELRLRHRTEGYRVFELRGMDMRRQGKLPGRLLTARDITQRRRAEEALRESEIKYRRLFDQSRDIVTIIGLDGRLLDVNRVGIESLGYESKEEVLQLDIAEQVYAEPAERQKIFEQVRRQGWADFETHFRTRTGGERLVDGTVMEMLDDDGAQVGFLGIVRDVTAERQTEDQLRQSQKMEALGRLAGGIAHDFNNMLTAINGYCDLLLDEVPEGPLRSYAREIAAAGNRAVELTAKLLDIGRRDAVEQRVVAINDRLRDLESLLARLIGEDVELSVQLDPEAGRVRVDPGQLDQALLNLAVNARDAMPTGGRLELRTRRVVLDELEAERRVELCAGDYVTISVEDTGHGMDAKTLEHAFEPFFTTKEAGKGTGLGLATVYATVRQFDGHIEVTSTPGRGTRFVVYLPRNEGPADATAVAEEAAADSGREQILLVEDDASVRQLLEAQLVRQGYEVLVAEDGASALALAAERSGAIDLLISDVVMPSMSGPELANRLAAEHPNLPVLFVSGYTDTFLVQHGFSEAEHEVLAKPFGSRTLATRVREILDRR